MYNKTTHKKDIYEYVIDDVHFWNNVERKGECECWPWLRGRNTTGYGLYSVKTLDDDYERTGRTRTQLLAHRVALSLAQHVEQHEYVMHACDNRKCCNPAHLRAGTQQDNVDDMIAKGRGYWQ